MLVAVLVEELFRDGDCDAEAVKRNLFLRDVPAALKMFIILFSSLAWVTVDADSELFAEAAAFFSLTIYSYYWSWYFNSICYFCIWLFVCMSTNPSTNCSTVANDF